MVHGLLSTPDDETKERVSVPFWACADSDSASVAASTSAAAMTIRIMELPPSACGSHAGNLNSGGTRLLAISRRLRSRGATLQPGRMVFDRRTTQKNYWRRRLKSRHARACCGHLDSRDKAVPIGSRLPGSSPAITKESHC